ncbi:MAG: ABC transporter substrate-binding protein, partial [Deltaproteobacteria bacterium]|nr:ABC transporter substrate-binding protein [Deltaproteobacteria bacterium]MBW2009700.1 ABC transporter substrate-binding protein [Deltaproteobacteria bacterium]
MERRNKTCWILAVLFFVSLLFVGAGLAETPKRGGDLVSGYGQFPRHFNHAIQSGAATATPGTQIF